MRVIERGRGFTLIEIVIVMVLLSILAVMAIPKFLDLTQNAKIATTQTALASIRSTLATAYGQSTSSANPGFPSSLTAAHFATNQLPKNTLTGKTGITAVTSPPAGTATDATNGFWYIVASGYAGAYSDGAVDTSSW